MFVRIWTVLLATMCSAQTFIPVATYYVDQSRGSDSNAGTYNSPFLTAAHCVSVLSGAQGCAIFGGSGSTGQLKYREALILSAGGQYLVGYGLTPIVSAASLITSGCTVYSGPVYQVTVSTDNPSGLGWMNVWQDDATELTTVSSLAALTTPGYFVTNNGSLTGASQTLYIYPPSGGNPCSNAHTYEYSARNQAIVSLYSSTVANIITEKNLHNNGSFVVGPGSFVSSVGCNWGAKHNCLMQGAGIGSYWQNVSATNSYYFGQAKIALVLFDNSPTGQDQAIVNFRYTENVEGGGDCLYGHSSVSGSYGLVTIINPLCGNGGTYSSDISGYDSSGMKIMGGNVSGGITLGSTTDIISGTTVGAQINLPYAVTATITGVNSSGSINNGNIRSMAVGSCLTITGNSFTNTNAGGPNIYFDQTPECLTDTGNTFFAPVFDNFYQGSGWVSTIPGLLIQGNIYHYPTAGSSWTLINGITYDISSGTRWAAWQALGYDTIGSRVTP